MNRDLWRDPRTWAAIAVIFSVLGVLNAVQLHVSATLRGIDRSFVESLAGTVPFWLAKASLLPGVLWAARTLPLERRRWAIRALPHVPLSLLYAAGHIALGASVWWILMGEPPAGPEFLSTLGQLYTSYLVVGIVYYWAFLGTILAFDYHRRFREREREAAELELRASRLESSLARASLDTLRMQLNPHFLFNTLNSISVLASRGNTDGVVRMLARLGDVLRATLDRTEPEVTLAEELSFLDTYLEIEQVRFDDRLTVARSIEPAARDAVVPSLLLQPLVENALKHGLGGARGPVRVDVEARVEGDRLELRVRDSGRGFPPAVGRRMGVGLSNTRERLRQLYGDDHVLELSPPGRGAEVRIVIPYVRDGGAVRSGPSGVPRAEDGASRIGAA